MALLGWVVVVGGCGAEGVSDDLADGDAAALEDTGPDSAPTPDLHDADAVDVDDDPTGADVSPPQDTTDPDVSPPQDTADPDMSPPQDTTDADTAPSDADMTADTQTQDTSGGAACAVGSMGGVCAAPGGCGGTLVGIAGYCEGDAAAECCVDAGGEPSIGVACSVAGVAGACLDTADCVGERVATPGHCPGPTEVQCCTPDDGPVSACDPQAAPRPNAGRVTEGPGAGGCPAGMLAVDVFCIDRHEASLVEVLADGSEVDWSPYVNPGTRATRAVSVAGAVPQAHISGTQAAAACAAAGKRLCTDDEWLRACQGPSGWVYPYGDARQPGVCNDARSQHPVVEYFGTSESWIWSELNNACINQLPDSLALTGAHPGCETAEGALDMMGNLHEWTADSMGTFRGGFYVDTVINGAGCLYRTTAHSVGHYDYSTGFRCCADR